MRLLRVTHPWRVGLGALLLATLSGRPAQSQAPGPAAMDSLLERLVGRWAMRGAVRGRPAAYRLDARRVLQGRFVELHMVDAAAPPAYEARVFLGVDSAGAQYIVHWMDNFGAGYSIPPATGTQRGDTLQFSFAYADGPFRDTFSFDRRAGSWHFLLESGDSLGRWRVFADYAVRRAP